jgi:hypothetical protein
VWRVKNSSARNGGQLLRELELREVVHLKRHCQVSKRCIWTRGLIAPPAAFLERSGQEVKKQPFPSKMEKTVTNSIPKKMFFSQADQSSIRQESQLLTQTWWAQAYKYKCTSATVFTLPFLPFLSYKVIARFEHLKLLFVRMRRIWVRNSRFRAECKSYLNTEMWTDP